VTRRFGLPLREDQRARLEEFFRADLRNVRLYSGRGVAAALAVLRVHGIVFGRRIFLSPGAAQLCAGETEPAGVFLAHEVCHVLQYRRLGFWKFLMAYAAGFLRAGRSYARIPFEVEAFETERRFREGRAL
jgi:Domain of unknown function (DUF4157)